MAMCSSEQDEPGRLDPLASRGRGMSAVAARIAERPTSPNEVWVNKLSGGPILKGSLADLGSAGARVILDRSLETGEVIRLTFPRESGGIRHQGRMIIGRVLHSRGVSGRHVVGVAFGWSTGCKRKQSPRLPKRGFWSWLRAYWGSRNSRRPVRSRKG